MGLHKLFDTTERAVSEKDEDGPYAPRTHQRKCEGRKCDEVDDFVTAVRTQVPIIVSGECRYTYAYHSSIAKF